MSPSLILQIVISISENISRLTSFQYNTKPVERRRKSQQTRSQYTISGRERNENIFKLQQNAIFCLYFIDLFTFDSIYIFFAPIISIHVYIIYKIDLYKVNFDWSICSVPDLKNGFPIERCFVGLSQDIEHRAEKNIYLIQSSQPSPFKLKLLSLMGLSFALLHFTPFFFSKKVI